MHWYRINAINGKSVKSLYGVSYLYGASGLFKSTTSSPTPTPTPPPTTVTRLYGPALGADSMGNQQIGGPSSGDPNLWLSYRFKAGQSSALKSIRWFQRGGTGYSGGTGGVMRIAVQADVNGLPAGTDLASTSYAPGNPGGSWNSFDVVTFPSPATLVAGTRYHIVFKNTDPSPRTNYISGNALWIEDPTTPRQPKFPDPDFAQFIHYSSGWRLQPEATPTLNLTYVNGAVEGMGYMEVWSNGAYTLGGESVASELFTVSGGDRVVAAVSVRLKRLSGTGALTLRLETSGGTLIEQGQATGVSTSASWATHTFAVPRTLANGSTYRLIVSCPAGTTYSLWLIRQGSAYGFDPRTYFGDGTAWSSSGGAWTAMQAPWGGNTGQSDLQFYFR
jgi:hypothetical protein